LALIKFIDTFGKDQSINKYLLLMRKLGFPFSMTVFTALLSFQSSDRALDDHWITPQIIAIATGLILFILIQWAIYKYLELRFKRKQTILEEIINKRNEDFLKEKVKTEALLANVLPKITADEIIAKGKATKTKFNFVTVLFSDIQGFTQIAEEMNPEVLID
jgi:hypothetical protein